MKRLLAVLFALVATQAGSSETVVAGLSTDRIAITANFDGSDILIYGAVKREQPIPRGQPLDVIITVEGPGSSELVRRKERQFGIWMNTESVTIDIAPSFYAIATTGPFEQIISDTEDLRQTISIPRAIRSVGASVEDSPSFTEALIRIRTAAGLYGLHEGAVRIAEQTLFRTDIDLPANLIEGNYDVRIFLLRDRAVVGDLKQTIFVRKVGLERWMFRLSKDSPAVYGALALILAAVAGWAASAGFALLRR